MPIHFGFFQIAVALGSLAMGFIIGVFIGMRARRMRNTEIKAIKSAYNSDSITVRVNGVREPIVIPEHYNSAAIDKLLKQLEIA